MKLTSIFSSSTTTAAASFSTIVTSLSNESNQPNEAFKIISENEIEKIWSILLSFFSGLKEVTFLSSSKLISYDLDDLNHPVLLASTAVDWQTDNYHGTAIFSTDCFNEDNENKLANLESSENSSAQLTIICLNQSSKTLKVQGYSPKYMLEHVSSCFLIAIEYFRHNHDFKIPLNYFNKLPKSISNPDPIEIKGPNLLCDLVYHRSKDFAIDFRDSRGQRFYMTYDQLDNASSSLAQEVYNAINKNVNKIINNTVNNGLESDHDTKITPDRKKQPVIAIMIPQSIELYVSELAILKSGSAFCCIPTDIPKERLNFILEDISCQLILTLSSDDDKNSNILESSTLSNLSMIERDMKYPILYINNDNIDLNFTKATYDKLYPSTGKDIAYIMYTSGSTGLPKGVCLSNQSVVQSLMAHNDEIPQFQRFLQFSSPAFDVSIFEIFFTWYRKSTLISCERQTMLNDLIGIINELKVDSADLTPTVVSSLLRKRSLIPTVKVLLTIGEMLTDSVIQEFGGNSQKESILCAMYGPTEVSIHCTLQNNMSSSSNNGNIGKPLKTCSAFIVEKYIEDIRSEDIGSKHYSNISSSSSSSSTVTTSIPRSISPIPLPSSSLPSSSLPSSSSSTYSSPSLSQIAKKKPIDTIEFESMTQVQVLPVGFVGELAIGGYQLANEYLNRSDQTSKVFIETRDYGRIYLTGDKARMNQDGTIECLGRISNNQVKIRGQRVELSEIEQTVLKLKGCKIAIANVISNSLVLFCSVDDLTVQEIQKECEKWLPMHMIPNDIIIKDKLPYLISGKIDKKGLIKEYEDYVNREFEELNDDDDADADQGEFLDVKNNNDTDHINMNVNGITNVKNNDNMSEIEDKIKNYISKLTDIPVQHIKLDVTIFRYGIDSVLAIHLAKLIRSSENNNLKSCKNIVASDVLRHPTIRKLSTYLTTYSDSVSLHAQNQIDFKSFQNAWLSLILSEYSIERDLIETIIPCTPIQNGMITRFLQSGDIYVNSLSYSLPLKVNHDQIIHAFEHLCTRHQMLRTGFISLNDDSFHNAMIIYRLNDLINSQIYVYGQGNGQDKVQRNNTRHHVSDIETWRQSSLSYFRKNLHLPPWKLLIQYEDDKIIFNFIMFHGLYDAISLKLLREELYSLLVGKSFDSSQAVKFLPSDIQSIEPVVNHIISYSRQNDVKRFWKDSLLKDTNNDDDEMLKFNQVIFKFPDMNPLKVNTIFQKGICQKVCSKSLKNINSSCVDKGISLLSLGQFTWANILSIYTLEPRVTFGLVLSGRDDFINGNEIMFPCLTTLPCSFDTSMKTHQVFDNIMKFNSEIRKFQFTPLTDISKSIGVFSKPLFDTIFSLLTVESSTSNSNWTLEKEIATDEYVIAFELEPTIDGNLVMSLTFDQNFVPIEQAEIMLNQIDFFLCGFESSFISTTSESETMSSESNFDTLNWKNAPINILSIVPPKQKELFSKVNLLHEFVEESAESNPDSIALEFVTSIDPIIESQTWTYRELNEKGNQIARYLIAKGVEPTDFIGICFEKCAEASFAILGILKAGCTYVAIDPKAPKSRKDYIINDSKCKIVLTLHSVNDVTFPGLVDLKELKDLNGMYRTLPNKSSNQSSDQDSKCLTNSQSLETSKEKSFQLIYLDDVKDLINKEQKCNIQNLEIQQSDVSYCLYTSGTTGNPKGCEISHENSVQAILAFSILFQGKWNKKSKWLQFASYHFDVSVLEQFWTWSKGIKLITASRDLILQDLTSFIQRTEITHLDLTPSLAILLNPRDVPSLTKGIFITGGESLRQDILDSWGKTKVIHNGYGPTETTIGVTMYTGVPENGKTTNIGKQFDNVGIYILKPNTNRPVLKGSIGELCISGKLVGKGYLNREELTKVKFPYIEEFQERIYRTGDLVRLLYDNSLEFIGRFDDQIKLRGQRLEISEIESIIKQVENVIDITTMILIHKQQNIQQLISFIVLRDDDEHEHEHGNEYEVEEDSGNEKVNKKNSKIDQDDQTRKLLTISYNKSKVIGKIFDRCKSFLSPYMIPTYILPINHIPLTANNKVDGNSLKQYFSSLSLKDLQVLIPKDNEKDGFDDKEKQLAQHVSKYFNIDVSAMNSSTNVFELGIDSISVMRFTAFLKHQGYKLITVPIVMNNPTIRLLSSSLSSNQVQVSRDQLTFITKQKILALSLKHRADISSVLHVDPSDIEYILPCTALQNGMMTETLTRKSQFYFITFELMLESSIDTLKLKEAWEFTYSQLSILKSQFVSSNDGFFQVVTKHNTLGWEEFLVENDEDFNDKIIESRNKWIDQNDTFISQPLSLTLLKSSNTNKLVLNMFHAIYDGWSLPRLLNFVYSKYAKNTLPSERLIQFSEVVPLGPLQTPYNWENFWKERLPSNWSSLEVKYDSEDSVLPIIIEHGSIKCSIEKLRRHLSVTHQAIILSCWSMVLSNHLKQIPVMGIVVSGRNFDFEGIQHVIGPMFNTLLFYPKIQSCKTWNELIKTVHDFNTSTLKYQHTPLRDVLRCVKKDGSLKGPNNLINLNNLSNISNLFVFQIEDESIENDLWKIREVSQSSIYPIAFEVKLNTSQMTLDITISADGRYFLSDEIKSMMELFENHIQRLTERDGRFSSLDKSNFDVQHDLEMHNITSETIGKDESKIHIKSNWNWNVISEKIRYQISSICGINQESIEHNISIFEYGLDSIDVIKLCSGLKKIGIDIKPSLVMKYQTIELISERTSKQPFGKTLEQITNDPNGMHRTKPSQKPSQNELVYSDKDISKFVSIPDMLKSKVEKILPATPLQEALYLSMVQSSFQDYYNHDVLKINQDVNIDHLIDVWTEVVKELPILRTCFLSIKNDKIDRNFVQMVLNPSMSNFSVAKVKDTSPESIIEGHIKNAAENQENCHTKLTFVTDQTQKLLILSIPHALYDGWSIQIIHKTVEELYSRVSPEVLTYDEELNNIIKESDNIESETYWKNYLSDCNLSILPNNYYDGIGNRIDNAQISKNEYQSQLKVSDIQGFCRKENITIHQLTLTCYSLYLSALTRQLQVTFALVLSGRETVNSQKVCFPMMNTVVFRSILYGSYRDMLKQTQNDISNILAYQNYPLRKALRFTNKKGSDKLSSMFLFQTKPTMFDEQIEPLYESIESKSNAEFDICVEAEVINGNLQWRNAISCEVMTPQNSKRHLKQLDDLLKAMLNNVEDECFYFENDQIKIGSFDSFILQENDQNIKLDGTNLIKLKELDRVVYDKNKGFIKNVIVDVLSQICAVDKSYIIMSTSLFELGFDSISSIKVSRALKDKGIILHVSKMMRDPTLYGLIENALYSDSTIPDSVQQKNTPNNISKIDFSHVEKQLLDMGISKNNVSNILPLTGGQEYFLASWILYQGSKFFSTFEFECNQVISRGHVQSCWSKLVNMHSVLRTVFISVNTENYKFVQVQLNHILPTIRFESKYDEVDKYLDTYEDEGQDKISSWHQQPFFQLKVKENDSKQTLLEISIHHALYDAISLKFLLQDFESLLSNESSSQDLTISSDILNESILSFVSFTYMENVDTRKFWSHYLESIDQSKRFEHSYEGQHETNELKKKTRSEVYLPKLISNVSKITQLAKDAKVSIQSMILAIFSKYLCTSQRQFEQKDVVIGMYLANRSHDLKGLSTSRFPTINIVPICIRNIKLSSVTQISQQIQKDLALIGSLTNSSVSLSQIYEWTKVKVDYSFNFLPIPVDDVEKRNEDVNTNLKLNSTQVVDQPRYNNVCTLKKSKTEIPVELSTLYDLSAYEETIDIEMALRDNGLDIGLFGPTEMISIDEASDLVNNFSKELETFSMTI